MNGDDFLSGDGGQLTGIRRTSRAVLEDAVADAVALGLGQRARLRRAAGRGPRRRILALGIEATPGNLLGRARAELARSRHQVDFEATVAGSRGKFENLNRLLTEHPPAGCDWLLVIDDDVALSPGFLDAFVFLAERFELRLAQPAHRSRSHSAWAVTRRHPGSVVRETAFVEIGPVTAFHASTLSELLPFPELRAGWGLDLHWSALARARGWRLGVVDATPIRHGFRPVAAAYDRSDAIAEAREFLRNRVYVTAAEAQRTLATHWTW